MTTLPRNAATPDAATSDAGTPDAGTPDAGTSDAADPELLGGHPVPARALVVGAHPDDADFGAGNTQAGRVLESEPGRRVVYGAPGPDGEPPMTLEFLVEGRDGGTTALRLVQSGFFDGDDWEAEYDGFGKGWDMFLHNLAEYFRHFPGLPAATVVATGFMSGYELPWGKIMATGTVIVLPVTVFALLVSRHMVRGLTMGASK